MENNMVYCRNCGAQIKADDAFCSSCGSAQVVAEEPNVEKAFEETQVLPTYQTEYQPEYEMQESIYQQPQTKYVYEQEVPPKASVKSKVFGGIGFGLSMYGFIFAFFSLCMSISTIDASYNEAEELASISMVYSLLFIATSIIGLSFSGIARKDGNKSALTVLGKVFGIIGIVFYGLAFTIAIGAIG
ncbi:MAG: zinc-ribbon domain-containing protein [Ruminococcaceae bacterium]|nr:zinc-ribbon domain-containing protein [Oscillospiraceae bacterium]